MDFNKRVKKRKWPIVVTDCAEAKEEKDFKVFIYF